MKRIIVVLGNLDYIHDYIERVVVVLQCLYDFTADDANISTTKVIYSGLPETMVLENKLCIIAFNPIDPNPDISARAVFP